jgi:hypothetical protein
MNKMMIYAEILRQLRDIPYKASKEDEEMEELPEMEKEDDDEMEKD